MKKRKLSRPAKGAPASTVETKVVYEVAAIIREARRCAWALFWMITAIVGSPLALDALNSKPAVAVAQYMVGEMEKPQPDGGALSGRAKRP